MAAPAAPYSADLIARGLRLGVVEGAFSFATFTLMSGVILAAFVYSTGMGALEYGLFTAMPLLAQLLQLPNIALLRRWPDRRTFTVVFASIGRVSLLGVSLALLFLPASSRVPIIVLSFAAWSAFSALAGGAWLWWMRDLVPADRLGRYFGDRGAALVGVSAPVLFGAGFYLDWVRAGGGDDALRLGFAGLFAVAALFGIISSVILTQIPNPPPTEDPRKVPLRDSLSLPFQDANFRHLLGWLSVWWFASTFTIPFFALFLLVTLGLPVSFVTALLLVGIIANVVFLRLWGRLSDRFGNKPVLAVAVPVLAAGLLLAAAVPTSPFPLNFALIVVIQVLLALAAAGADLTAWNLAFKLSHGPSAPSFLAAASLIRALSTGLGPVAGGIAAALLAGVEVRIVLPAGSAGGIVLLDLTQFTILFIAGAVLVLASTALLAHVREAGEAPRSALLEALRIEAAGEGMVPGVRHFATATAVAVQFIVDMEERTQMSLDAGLLAIAEAIQSGGETIEGGEPVPPGQP